MFILDDPRFLEGGVNNHYEMNYSTPLITYDNRATLVDTQAVMSTIDRLLINKPTTLREIAGDTVKLFDSGIRKNLLEYILANYYNQSIHCGRNSYHHRPSYNVFVPKNDAFPSVGVELEMMKKQKFPDSEVSLQLKSNWFHFERDGSLGDSAVIYPCVVNNCMISFSRSFFICSLLAQMRIILYRTQEKYKQCALNDRYNAHSLRVWYSLVIMQS